MSKNVYLSAVATAALLSVSAAAFAQGPIDRRNYFTFSGPVEIPGATLPAGKYIFRVPNPDTSHSVVQVTSADGKKVYGMFFTMPMQRPDAAKDPEVRFMETSANSPQAIRTWWQPGERTGSEFVYPKEQARRLAKTTHQPVLAMKTAAKAPTETKTEDIARVSEQGDETAVTESSASAAPAGVALEGQIALNQTDSTNAAGRSSLPQTASMLPTVALTGLAALLCAAALFGWRGSRDEV